jgi:hypothetical protein
MELRLSLLEILEVNSRLIFQLRVAVVSLSDAMLLIFTSASLPSGRKGGQRTKTPHQCRRIKVQDPVNMNRSLSPHLDLLTVVIFLSGWIPFQRSASNITQVTPGSGVLNQPKRAP